MRKLVILSVAYALACVAVFSVLYHLEFDGDYLTSGTAAVVGYLAYLVYELEQINRLKSAAKIIILDVRNAEEALAGVHGGANYSAWSKFSVIENNWPKLKQHFITLLTTDEFRIFDHFFHAWSEVVSAKNRFEGNQYSAILAKSEYTQQKLLDLWAENPADLELKRNAIIARANAETFLFEPNLPQSQLSHFLSLLRPLSGTTGFEKLRKTAGMR